MDVLKKYTPVYNYNSVPVFVCSKNANESGDDHKSLSIYANIENYGTTFIYRNADNRDQNSLRDQFVTNNVQHNFKTRAGSDDKQNENQKKIKCGANLEKSINFC